jgi:hypothetical protein
MGACDCVLGFTPEVMATSMKVEKTVVRTKVSFRRPPIHAFRPASFLIGFRLEAQGLPERPAHSESFLDGIRVSDELEVRGRRHNVPTLFGFLKSEDDSDCLCQPGGGQADPGSHGQQPSDFRLLRRVGPSLTNRRVGRRIRSLRQVLLHPPRGQRRAHGNLALQGGCVVPPSPS